MAASLEPNRSTPIDRLMALIDTLRGENGCPWDKQQTPDTMARYLVEEVYELVDAIVSRKAEHVCEEAGDVLFQLIFVIQLFKEAGSFSFQDVIENNIKKMVRRHPHVFGEVSATTPEKVSENWQKIKLAEKGRKQHRSALDSVPRSMPALLRAAMVSERAAKTGFDWDDISSVMAKTMEEWQEFSAEMDRSEGPSRTDRAGMEFGDILFSMVNVARFAGVHPEIALLQSIQKFEKRFTFMEDRAMAIGRTIDSLTFDEMHKFWDEAKAKLG